jgi:tripeptide aminopeptidase
MLKSYKNTVTERFLRYVKIDTQSDPDSSAQPSTEKQKDLSRVLVDELHAMGISDAELMNSVMYMPQYQLLLINRCL